MQNKEDKLIIECDCGAHLLQVVSDIEYFDNHVDQVRYQEYYLAMFSYGSSYQNAKTKWWKRIAIAWRYLRTSEMHRDQLCLKPEEAKKLADFINNTIKK